MQPSCCKYTFGSAELCLLLILFVTVSVPGSDVPHQDVLDGAGVEISQYLRGYPEFPQASELKQSLPCISHLSQCPAPSPGPQGNLVLGLSFFWP